MHGSFTPFLGREHLRGECGARAGLHWEKMRRWAAEVQERRKHGRKGRAAGRRDDSSQGSRGRGGLTVSVLFINQGPKRIIPISFLL